MTDSRTKLALPYRDAMPSHGCERFLVGLISFPVACDLPCPEISIGFRHPEIPASFVSMPKASIHKDACTIFAHDEVGMSGQSSVIKPVSESPGKKKPSNNPFRLCISRPDGSHVPMSALGVFDIHLLYLKEREGGISVQMPNPPVNDTSTALLCRILDPGGTLCVSQMLPPITVLCPIVIRPRLVELA